MRYARWLTVITAGILASVLAGITASLAWDHQRDDRQLLPGTTIAGVEVGERSVDAATEAVRDHLASQLEADLMVHAAGERWTVSGHDLRARPDVEGAIAEALARTEDVGLFELARFRLLGEEADLDLDVDLRIDRQELDRLVSSMADEVDHEPRDATLAWDGERIELSDARDGRALDQQAATHRIREGIIDRRAEVELPVRTIAPPVPTDHLAPLLGPLNDLTTAALDRQITVAAADTERTVTPRELDVRPDVDAILQQLPSDGTDAAAALPDTPDELPVTVAHETVERLVDELANAVERAPRDADLDWSSGELRTIEERSGRSLDTHEAHARVVEAIRSAGDRVELETRVRQPAVTTEDLDPVLFLRLDRRELQLHRDGEVVREWPVAVGQPSHPTPTGVFTVGAKRVDPTWTNPAPNGWGADLPEVVGPGPDNPMGPRAVNWNRNGSDTLIRFHGTNEPSSIGTAASRGCVRMFNDDVIELYELVPRGTTIVSIEG